MSPSIQSKRYPESAFGLSPTENLTEPRKRKRPKVDRQVQARHCFGAEIELEFLPTFSHADLFFGRSLMEYSNRVGDQTPSEEYEASIGLIECSSIAIGILVTDAVIKQSPVEVLWSRSISPGHWLTLFTGEVEEVREAMDRGVSIGGKDVVDDLFIANLHPQVTEAIRGPRKNLDIDAVGIVEFRHVASTIVAADAAVKTAAVDLLEIRLGMHLGGKGYLVLTGATADVEDAVGAAAAVGRDRNTLIRDVVISRAAEELIPFLIESDS
jgi:microcompartment protein CcmL/EutN